MMTTADNKVLVDTNVLISATLPARAQYENALRVLDDWPNQGVRLCTTGQILREYLVVATRPVELNGLSLSAAVASENAAKLRGRMLFCDETRAVFTRLQELMAEVGFTGKQVHDANVVATALTHGVSSVVTANTAHFERFTPLVEILNLDDV